MAGASGEARFPFLLAALLLVVAAGLRGMGVGNDLWLDEVWSVFITTQLHSPLEVFTLHHEINHHLNTLWLYLIGPGASAVVYHAWSFFCGIASVGVAGWIGWRRGRAGAILAMMLVGVSYVLVAYSAEARGYSSLVLFSLLSFQFLSGYLERSRWRGAALYAGCAILGLLSHPIFIAFLGAAMLWSMIRLGRSGGGMRGAVAGMLACQGLPLAGFALLYWIDLRHVVAGGGTSAPSLLMEFGKSLGWAWGSPQDDVWMAMFSLGALLGAGMALWNLYREGSDRWIFYATVCFLFPISLVLARGSDLVYTRHFMVGTTFLLLLWSDGLAVLWDRGFRARVAVVILLLVYIGCNGRHVAEWVVHGRGQPTALLSYIADQAEGRPVTMGGDVDFRIGVVMDYYRLAMPEARGCHYLAHSRWPAGGPDWYITHAESWMPAASPRPVLRDARGNRYEWVRTFPTAPLSGLHLFVYRNRPLGDTSPAERRLPRGALSLPGLDPGRRERRHEGGGAR